MSWGGTSRLGVLRPLYLVASLPPPGGSAVGYQPRNEHLTPWMDSDDCSRVSRDCNYSGTPAIARVVCPEPTEGDVNPVSFTLEEINNRNAVAGY